jgi:hypothetical protein
LRLVTLRGDHALARNATLRESIGTDSRVLGFARALNRPAEGFFRKNFFSVVNFALAARSHRK